MIWRSLKYRIRCLRYVHLRSSAPKYMRSHRFVSRISYAEENMYYPLYFITYMCYSVVKRVSKGVTRDGSINSESGCPENIFDNLPHKSANFTHFKDKYSQHL